MRYVTTLVEGLCALGHRVTIGCREGSVLVEQNSGVAGIVDRFHFRGGLRPRAWINDVREAQRFIRRERPDIIHVNGSQDHWTMAATKVISDHAVPLLRTRHNTYSVALNGPNRLLNRRLTDFQIVVCDSVRRTLASHPAFHADRLRTIHNGVDASLYQPNPAARRKARSELGFVDSDIVCGIVARLVPAKGHVFLFQAVASLKALLPDLRILVFGQGVLEDELRLLADSLGIASMIRFAGFRNDMQYWVQAIDIGAQPSIDCDTSSFSMKEQMAAGIPVIASAYGGLGEIIDDGVEGILTPPGTTDPLAEALKRLTLDAELRTRMGTRARERVIAEFSKEVFVGRTLETYYSVIENVSRALQTGKRSC